MSEKHQSDSLFLGISKLLSNSNAGFSRPKSVSQIQPAAHSVSTTVESLI